MSTIYPRIIFLGFLLFPTVLHAQAVNDLTEGMGAAFARTMFALLLILALFFGLVYLLKRFGSKWLKFSNRISGEGNTITILETKYLNPKRQLYLVRVRDKEILIGSSESGFQLLSEFSPGISTFEDELSKEKEKR
ncbi:flagellar biosynthetic protein FliO [bacterium]|nr:flagellar biosynthetic protein FliO [bacterium]